MGNSAGINKIPKDVTKCSLDQLQEMINLSIISNPWSREENRTDEEKLRSTIRSMRKRGMRPITSQEYYDQLKKCNQYGANIKIHLWKRIEDEDEPKKCFSLDTSMTESDDSGNEESLPTTSEEAAQIFRDLAGDDEKVDSASETVAWAANIQY